MAKLVWDKTSERLFETGIKKCVLYPIDENNQYLQGVVWNGVTAVTEAPSGGEITDLYADDDKYLDLMTVDEFGATIEAYSYPKEFAECDGTVFVTDGLSLNQQVRQSFGFCYRTSIGNDVIGSDYGYELHLVYGVMAAPSDKDYNSLNDTLEPITFSWECTTIPVELEDYMPVSQIVIRSTDADYDCLKELEDILYGTDSSSSRLPSPDEVLGIFSGGSSTVESLIDSNNERILDSNGNIVQGDKL